MSSRHRIRALLEHPEIWQAGGASQASRRVFPTGFKQLDLALAGGWPANSLIELLVGQWGSGELRLLMPALRAVSLGDMPAARTDGWILFVDPPYIPYAPGLAVAGIDLARVLVVRCQRPGENLWAMEQALRSEHCAVVAGWCGQAGQHQLRRLQLAAETRRCWMLLFRPVRFRQQRSPAALRLAVRSLPGQKGIHVDIIRQRAGLPQQLRIDA